MTTNFSDYLSQGKSNNYLVAEENGKIKAGEVAKILTKKFGIKIYAKEIECFATEWHHAGVFQGYTGKLMGRKVRFFTHEEIENITLESILENRGNQTKKEEKENQMVKGWFVKFERIRINHYGKLGWKPFVGLYEGLQGNAPKNFTSLTDEEFEDARKYEGSQLISFANYYYQTI